MTTTQLPPYTRFPEVTRPVPGIFRQLGRDTRYVLVGFPLAIVTFVIVMVAFWLGVGTVVTVAGLPILAGAFFLARGFAVGERGRVAEVLGERLPHPAYRKALPGDGFLRRMSRPLGDPSAWRDLAHGAFRFIPSTVAFAFVVAWWAGAVGGLTAPLWDWAIPRGPNDTDLPELLGLGSGAGMRIAFSMAAGALLALTLIPVVRMAARLEAGFARALLGPTEATSDTP